MLAVIVLVILGLAVIGLVIERQIGRRRRAADSQTQLYRDAVEARRVVEKSERRFRSLVAATAQVIWIADVDGAIDDSPMWRELTGQRREEVLGHGWLDAVHPDDRASAAAAWQRAVETVTIFQAEYRVRMKSGIYRWFLARGVPVLDPGGRVSEWVGTCTDIDEQKRAHAAEDLLLETARTIQSSLDLGTTLREVTSVLVPRFGEYCLVYLRESDGSFRQAAAAHVDPDQAGLLEELGRRHRPDLANPNSGVARVTSTSMPLLMRAPSDDEARLIFRDPEALRIHQQLAPVSYIVVPLIARGEAFGVMSVASTTPAQAHDAEDLALVELLGARAALAIDNARLHTEVRETRDRALRAARLEAELAQARLEALRAQLNPHFLFNALNTIAMLVRRKATPDALRGVVSLSELLRKVLAGRGALEVPLREELALVDHYLSVEKLRFREHLAVEVAVQPDTLDVLVPSLILQPIIENAVRHGVARGSGTSHILLECSRNDGKLRIAIRDDGPGFPEGWDPATSGGLGLANTRERLQRMYMGDQRFEVTNSPDGGALVTLEIPLNTAPSARRSA